MCVPGTTTPCYGGPAGTEGAGICKPGQATCAPDGSGYGACVGEVTPAPDEACDTAVDDDCDGAVNEPEAGCVCEPGSVDTCYSGPAGTMGVGLCVAGTKTCAADGKSYGACSGEVLPQAETCTTPGDDDCNGKTNEGGAGCACVPDAMTPCYSGPPATQGIGPCHGGTQTCNAQGTGFGPCVGEVIPSAEVCGTPIDDNCNGEVNEGGADCVCPPSAVVPCYSGPGGTLNVGICKAGAAQCDSQGLSLGPCVGEVVPQPETCNTAVDDDCNGQVNEGGAGCVCLPNSAAPCYSGPAGTQNVGACKGGTKTCNGSGTAYGACVGEVTPAASELCNTASDDNCNGQANEGCPPPVSYALDVQPILGAKCAPCHTVSGSGGANLGNNYASTQLASYYCVGKTKGACALTRIQNGTMPAGGTCTGNPALDAGKPQCLTAAEQATIQAWIDGGQLP